MIYRFGSDFTFSIAHVTTCDFSLMDRLGNDDVIARSAKKSSRRLDDYISEKFGITSRYWCKENQNAIDLARSALSRLLAENPEIREEAEFFIFAGISNPLPATTLSSLLAEEFDIKNASCWDLKSGCSTGVLALLQAMGQIQMGARKGIIVAAENLSRFADPDMLQIAMTIGDGACALYITDDRQWQVRSALHGTDAAGSSFMRVPVEFPPVKNSLPPYYVFNDKPQAVKMLQHYWLDSLGRILQLARVLGTDISHYIAHQIDTEKNRLIAQACAIPQISVALNFSGYGNMGCPTVFINYHEWLARGKVFHKGELMVLQAVGGGVSWAGMCLEYVG